MRKTDINKFTGEAEQQKAVTTNAAVKGAKGTLSIVWKLLSTFLMILCVSLVVVGISVMIYLFGLANEPTGIDLHASKLQLTSFIYVNDENGNPVEYQRLHSTENRIWVDYEDIPQSMKDAIIAIEDKRFYDHNGVDWVRTAGAVFSLASGSDSYGGSTLTQQLIKNITDDNQVSITRKLRGNLSRFKFGAGFYKRRNFGSLPEHCQLWQRLPRRAGGGTFIFWQRYSGLFDRAVRGHCRYYTKSGGLYPS